MGDRNSYECKNERTVKNIATMSRTGATFRWSSGSAGHDNVEYIVFLHILHGFSGYVGLPDMLYEVVERLLPRCGTLQQVDSILGDTELLGRIFSRRQKFRSNEDACASRYAHHVHKFNLRSIRRKQSNGDARSHESITQGTVFLRRQNKFDEDQHIYVSYRTHQ